ncbi:MAG: hypothetical protein ONB55_22750, partial [candidate division KSB1 bacterium]|nr:hypothetical protein [candidate division KSB1 bacterium]
LMLCNVSPLSTSAQEINTTQYYLEENSYLPEVTTDAITYNNQENSLARIPNGIPITVTPRQDGTGVDVKVNNIGADGLDSVTVTVKATGYSNSKSVTYYVPALLGKNFAFDFPMIKCNTVYDVTIKITDGGQTKTLYGQGTLTYSETTLANANWNRGTFSSRAASIEYHLSKHGAEVSANNIVIYLNKANSYRSEVISNINNGTASRVYTITTGTGTIPSKKYKNISDGRFIILANSGYSIFSFGR